jgi:hypothetical protein
MRRYTEIERQRIVQAFESSTLSASAFCLREGVSTVTLARWRKRCPQETAISAPRRTPASRLPVVSRCREPAPAAGRITLFTVCGDCRKCRRLHPARCVSSGNCSPAQPAPLRVTGHELQSRNKVYLLALHRYAHGLRRSSLLWPKVSLTIRSVVSLRVLQQGQPKITDGWVCGFVRNGGGRLACRSLAAVGGASGAPGPATHTELMMLLRRDPAVAGANGTNAIPA